MTLTLPSLIANQFGPMLADSCASGMLSRWQEHLEPYQLHKVDVISVNNTCVHRRGANTLLVPNFKKTTWLHQPPQKKIVCDGCIIGCNLKYLP